MIKNTTNFVKNKKDHKILTSDGLEWFGGVNKIVKDSYIHLTLSNNIDIKCSADHPFLTIEGYIKAKDLDKKNIYYTKIAENKLIYKAVTKELLKYAHHAMDHNLSLLEQLKSH